MSCSESRRSGPKVDQGCKTLGCVCLSSLPDDNLDGETSKEFAKGIDGPRAGNLLHSSIVSTTQHALLFLTSVH
jgi:hypothetical protein